MNTPPKVFISHASEDKERFVEDFARHLRSCGIEAWLDKWEIMPGDDLPTSVFEKGIATADAVVVVLSPHFLAKPWPRHELSASLIKRIYGNTRIIPVIIEECEVPTSLRSTLWVRVHDMTDYDAEFRRIVDTILGNYDKPPLGHLTPPQVVDNIPGLTNTDTVVLKKACELTLKSNGNWVGSASLQDIVRDMGISEEEATESIEILGDRHMVKAAWTMGGLLPSFRITPHGFENYARFYIPGFTSIVNNALVAIVNHNFKSAGSVARHLEQDQMLIEHVLEILADRKLIQLVHVHGADDGTPIHQVLPQGRRYAAMVGK